MPKKRGRPPKKQTTVQRGRGRPRKSANTRESVSFCAGDVVSASIVPPIAQEYSPSKPFVTPVVYDGGLTPAFEPVEPVPHDVKFQFAPPRPNPDDFEAVVIALTRVYAPDDYILKVFVNTLAYITNRKLNPRRVFKLIPRDILHFFAIINYMGYCP